MNKNERRKNIKTLLNADMDAEKMQGTHTKCLNSTREI